MNFSKTDTALVVIDPQNDVLSEKGVSWALVGASVKENNTVENLARLFKAAKDQDYGVFISPHYLYPHDQAWRFGGAVEKSMLEGKEFFRPDPLGVEGFAGSGADWLDRYKPFIEDGKTVVVSPHKVWGPQTNDLVLQLRKRRIDKVILAGMLANLCVESHLRELLEQGFEIAVVKDATAGPRLPEIGDGYKAALINYGFLANAVLTTDETVKALRLTDNPEQAHGNLFPLDSNPHRRKPMSTITVKDGTEIYYKDWGGGQPIVFSHGWPLSGDDWDAQMMFFLNRGYRVIAHDRRGHGRSSQPGDGHDMDHYADDLAALTAHLNLKNAVHVGHSTGGGEVVRYIARHGESRVAKAVLISAVPPLMVKTPANPGGLPKEVFDGFQAQVAGNRAQFYLDVASGPFYGFNRPGANPSQGVIRNWWRQGMMGGAKAHYDGVVAFSQTDFTEDLKKFTVPTLVMHGDDDQIVPYADSGPLTAKLVKGAILKTYKGFPHGMPTTNADQINADLLAFLKT